MTKIEQFICIWLGFFIFEIIFIRIGFFLTLPITFFTLPVSLFLYLCAVVMLYLPKSAVTGQRRLKFIPILFFIMTIAVLSAVSFFLEKTFDTSWDGQGYHQTAVIALANGWNPVWQPSIQLGQRLPSQIFAEGYPPALWEIEATIYAITGRINSAKVMNVAIAGIAFFLIYSVLRKIRINKFLSFLFSLCIVLQPIYVIQLLTFMEDGFGYELLLIAVSSLLIFIVSHKAYWAIATFFLAEYLLVTVKYSHLPAALILGIIASLVIFNRFLSREYLFSTATKFFIFWLFLTGIIFAYLPYGRNIIFHKSLFYPTNIPALMGSVTYNNVPNNLQKSNKFDLLFYGIFSRAQLSTSGDPRNKDNIAVLKYPFSFSYNEVQDSVSLYNNRVGGGGPLFSGAVVLAVLLILITYFTAKSISERYAVYIAIFSFLIILLLSLVAPTPNLMRYVNQIQLLPFVVIIPLLALFRNTYVRLFCLIIFLVVCVNVGLFSYVVIQKDRSEWQQIHNQFSQMKSAKRVYAVKTQQFYSSYIILQEQHIAFQAFTSLPCQQPQSLLASSTTVQYCLR